MRACLAGTKAALLFTAHKERPVPPGPIDASGVIPTEYARQIVQCMLAQSAVLQLGKRMPLGTGIA